jgi:acetylornithine deacetylase
MAHPHDPSITDGAELGVQGEVLRGLGAAAPKGAVAAMVTALEAVIATGAGVDGSIALGIATKDLWADHAGVKELDDAQLLDADWVVAGEPSGNRLVLGARGIAQVSLRLTGVPAHWGRPQDAENPLYGLADILAAIRASELPEHPGLGRATMSPFEVQSEAAPPHTPHMAAVRVDRRILPGEDAEAVVESIAALARDACARTPGLSVELVRDRMMHPFDIPRDHPLVTALQRRIEVSTGHVDEPIYISFSSNAGFTTAVRGWPSVAFGPGEITALGPDEHVSTKQLGDAARAFAAMMTMGSVDESIG